MSDLDVVFAALERAETEMRYAGWDVFQPDNVGRMDAMRAVQDAIAILTAEPDREEPMPSKVANHVSHWKKVETSNDYDPKGLHITQPLVQSCRPTEADRRRLVEDCGLTWQESKPQIAAALAEPQGAPVARLKDVPGQDHPLIFWLVKRPPAGTFLYTRPQPLRDLSDEGIDKAWRSVDYTVSYDQFRIAVGRAIIAAAREKA